jgi:Flp pilus assembly secretin CpaC
MNTFFTRTAFAHLAALALACICVMVGQARAEGSTQPMSSYRASPVALGEPTGRTVAVDVGGALGATRTLALPRGKSAVIELPVDADNVMVSDPKVANVVISSRRRMYVLGVDAGQTDAMFVDGAGRQILRLHIRVDQDISALGDTLNRLLPGAVIGQVGGSQFSLANAASYAVNGAYLGSLSAGYNLNTTQQPQLQVPCTTSSTGYCPQNIHPGANYYTNAAGQKVLITNTGTATLQNTAGSTGLNQAASTLQAYEQVGLVRTLAEPNLTVVSGEAGHFLAGGEFPVPIGEDITGRISVEYKEFGVGLGFTPVVLSKGRISLKISTEYSELTNLGSLTQGSSTSTTTSTTGTTTSSSPSYTIPGLTVRRAETVVELPSGGAMMIAGLLESTHKQDISSLPGLMDLPVLGALFRSRDFQQAETELVVIVTPYIVKSVSPDQLQTPADGLQIADDLSTTLLGELNKGFNKTAAPPPGKTYQGPFGYVVE